MMFYILLVLFFVLFSFLSYRNLVWGICLIVLFLPSYLIRFQLFVIPSTVLEGMILILAALWIYAHRQQLVGTSKQLLKGKLPSEPFNQWFLVMVLFFVSATVAAFVSDNHVQALGIWKAYFIESIVFFSIFISSVKTRKDVNKVIACLVLSGLVVAIFAVIQKFTGWLIPNPFWQAVETRRVTSFFGYPNAVALYLAPMVPFIVYLFEKDKKDKVNPWLDLYYFFTFLIFLLAIYFTKSFGGAFALVATLLILGLFNKKTRIISFVILVFAGVIIYFTPLHDPFSHEILFQDVSGQIRVNMWGETVEMLKLHPLTGAGLSNYQLTVAPYHILKWVEIYLYPHNVILNFWSETGFFGLLSFFWLVALFIREGLRQIIDKHHHAYLFAEVLLASMLIILIQGMVDVPYFKNDLSVVFWLLMGLMVVNSFLKE